MANAFKVTGLWSALGVMLSLIALYLVLENYLGATSVANAVGSNTNNIFRTLQGR